MPARPLIWLLPAQPVQNSKTNRKPGEGQIPQGDDVALDIVQAELTLEAGDLDVVEGVARLCYQTVLHALLTACKVDLGGRVGLFQSTGNGQCWVDMSGGAAGCNENTHGDSSL